MPDPGSLSGNLAKSADAVVAAGQKVQQNAKDAAARNAPTAPETGLGRPLGPQGPQSPAQPGGGPR